MMRIFISGVCPECDDEVFVPKGFSLPNRCVHCGGEVVPQYDTVIDNQYYFQSNIKPEIEI